MIPPGYAQFLADEIGTQKAAAAVDAFALPARPGLRVNRLKISSTPKLEQVRWCQEGIVLEERPLFAADPWWHAGAYYVQEAASMAAAQALVATLPGEPSAVLDVCAAPGGKTTHLAALLPQDCLLVGNEVIRTRTGRLQENLARWGRPSKAVISHDAATIGARCGQMFDGILLDAPCSGEGLFRKDANAAVEWSPEHVAFCAARQKRILADIWPALAPGGVLAYSTCTLNRQENERIMEWAASVLDAERLAISSTLTSTVPGAEAEAISLRFLPDTHGSEGFFLALLRKPGEREDNELTSNRKTRERLALPAKAQVEALRQLLPGVEAEALFEHQAVFKYLPAGCRDAAQRLLERVSVLSLGMALATLQKNGPLPEAEAAFWPVLPGSELYASVDFTIAQAHAYLRRDDMRDALDIAPGLYMARYDGQALGWLKAIAGGRISNYYPAGYRLHLDANHQAWSLSQLLRQTSSTFTQL